MIYSSSLFKLIDCDLLSSFFAMTKYLNLKMFTESRSSTKSIVHVRMSTTFYIVYSTLLPAFSASLCFFQSWGISQAAVTLEHYLLGQEPLICPQKLVRLFIFITVTFKKYGWPAYRQADFKIIICFVLLAACNNFPRVFIPDTPSSNWRTEK